jgi:hypothetical protein
MSILEFGYSQLMYTMNIHITLFFLIARTLMLYPYIKQPVLTIFTILKYRYFFVVQNDS